MSNLSDNECNLGMGKLVLEVTFLNNVDDDIGDTVERYDFIFNLICFQHFEIHNPTSIL